MKDPLRDGVRVAESPPDPSDALLDNPFSARSGGKRRPWRTALKFLISAGLLAWIVGRADLGSVRDALSGVDARWLALALLLNFVGAALITLRFGGLLAVRNITPGFRYLFVSTLVSGFFRQFLPSIIGGDAVRGYDAWRAGAEPGFAVVALVMDRLLGLLVLAIFALAAIALIGDLQGLFSGLWMWIVAGGILLLGAIAALSGKSISLPAFPSSLRRRLPAGPVARLDKFARAFGAFRNRRRALLRGLMTSVLLQANVVTFYWTLSMALGLELDYLLFYAIVPIAVFVMMLPVTVNGIGLREAIFVSLFALWNVDEAYALAFAWLEYGTILSYGLIGGVIYALRRQ